jgi:hypothetical protein
MPPAHLSPNVQALPSLQVAALLAKVQPTPGVQRSSVQALLSLQANSPLPLQAPWPSQRSVVVQKLPSLQTMPSKVALPTAVQLPVATSKPSKVHGLPSSQKIAVPKQALPSHLSTLVQGLLSVQALPSRVTDTQPPAALQP